MHKQWIQFAPGYSEVVLQGNLMPQVHAAFVDSLKPLLQDKKDIKILDVAAASGEPSLSLAAALPNAKIIATDIAENYVPLGRAQAEAAGLSDQVSFEVADGENLSQFDDNSFDAVTCSLGLMFFPNEGKGLSEFYRVLKPNGIFAATFWGAEVPFFTKAIAVAQKITPPESAAVDAPVNIAQRFKDGKGLCELITKTGFADLEHKELDITFKLKNNEKTGDWWDQIWKTPFPLKAAVMQAEKIPGHENVKEEAKKLLSVEFGDWISDDGSLVGGGNMCHFVMAKKP
jgi:ubiquinone/menaquinone biosynthesis C-methylase UbiE